MKKYKYYVVGIIVLLFVGVVGCDFGEEGPKVTEKESENTSVHTEENVVRPTGTYEEGCLVEIYADCRWVPQESYLPFSGTPSGGFTEGENGIYRMPPSDSSRIHYWDATTGMDVILCGKVDCEHEDESCNAYHAGIIDYVEGKLYIFQRRGMDQVTFYRVDPDGSNWEKIQEGTPESRDGVQLIPSFSFIYKEHRYMIGRLGAKEDGTPISVVCRMKLEEEAELEIIYQYEGEEWTESSVMLGDIMGEELYFSETKYRKTEDMAQSLLTLYKYNIRTGEIATVLEVEDVMYISYVATEEALYYSVYRSEFTDTLVLEYEPIMRIDRKSGEVTEFISQGGMIQFDGQFFYVSVNYRDTERGIRIYNLEGEILEWIETQGLEGEIQIYTTPSYIIFEEMMTGEDGCNIEIIPKTEIGKEKIRYSPVNYDSFLR